MINLCNIYQRSSANKNSNSSAWQSILLMSSLHHSLHRAPLLCDIGVLHYIMSRRCLKSFVSHYKWVAATSFPWTHFPHFFSKLWGEPLYLQNVFVLFGGVVVVLFIFFILHVHIHIQLVFFLISWGVLVCLFVFFAPGCNPLISLGLRTFLHSMLETLDGATSLVGLTFIL